MGNPTNYIGFYLWMPVIVKRIGLTLRESAALIRVPDGRIAQSVEQWIENPRVGGSIPPPATIYLLLIHWVINLPNFF